MESTANVPAGPGADREGKIVVNGDPLEWHEGMTVRDVLTAKRYVFPLLVVTVDGTLVPRGAYDSAAVPAGADVKVVHLISGG